MTMIKCILLCILIFACGFVFHIGTLGFIICIILFGLVLAGECFNTAIEILNKLDINVKVLNLKECKDPDEFIKNLGKEAFEDFDEEDNDNSADC